MPQNLLDLTYEFLLKKKQANFNEIFEYVKKHKNISSENELKEKANLYTYIVLDNRFLLVKDNEFVLRENCKFEEVKKQFDFLFSITDKEFSNTEELLSDNLKLDEENNNTENSFNESDFNDEDEKIDWDEIEKEFKENN